MPSIIATGAVLCGGAAIVHNNFSPISRVERMHKDVKEAEDIYGEVISKGTPRLQTEQIQKLVAHSRSEQLHTTRMKDSVRVARQTIRKSPWYKRSIPGFFKSLGSMETTVHEYLDDAVNTSALVNKIIAETPEHNSEEILQHFTDVSEALAKQDADPPLPNKDSLIKSDETLSIIGEEEDGGVEWTN